MGIELTSADLVACHELSQNPGEPPPIIVKFIQFHMKTISLDVKNFVRFL